MGIMARTYELNKEIPLLVFCEIFQNNFFHRTAPMAASGKIGAVEYSKILK